MGKIVYSWVIRRDSKIPGTVVRSSTIPEQLGRISYLLTDKTGECLYKGQREAGWGPADLGPLSGAGRGGGSCFLPRYWMKRECLVRVLMSADTCRVLLSWEVCFSVYSHTSHVRQEGFYRQDQEQRDKASVRGTELASAGLTEAVWP